MKIQYAQQDDLALIKQYDKHITTDNLLKAIIDKRVLIIMQEDIFCGWLRYNLFWDNTPFLNMICVLKKYQNKQMGTKLILFWEKQMQKQGYPLLMTSTLSDESAQHFYRKLGYVDSGSLLLKGEALEIIFTKII